MTTSQDLARLEGILQTEDITTLKRRRSNNRRDASRNERFYKDCSSQTLEDLDVGSIEHHLEKIETNISIAELLQNAILVHIKVEDEEKEEDDHHVYHKKMLATRKGLTQQLNAARVREQSSLARATIDSLAIEPTLTGYGIKSTLSDLSVKVTNWLALAHPLKDRPELMGTLQRIKKDLTTLQERYDTDNPNVKVSTAKDIKPKETSKFDRLPRIELPSFNGDNGGWRPYWEKFNNALEKDPTLTDVDRLSFLLMTMKCKEGKEIIDSHTRQGPDYNAAVRALKERYDQPRVISRSTHQSFTKHVWKLTNEGIGQLITLIQRTIATMKECAVNSLETLYAVIAELHMPDDFFRYWTEKTVEAKTPPTTDRLIEVLQQYRLRLQGRTIDSPSASKPSIMCPAKQKQGRSTTLHVQKEGSCTLCHDGSHPLYLCATFKAKSVEERSSTASRLKVCTNCLSYNHFSRDCPSRRSCRECGGRHHSLLHRRRTTTYVSEDTSERQQAVTGTNAHITPTCNASHGEAKVVLGVCQVTVSSRGRLQKARALLDSGSHMSFVTSRLAQSLKVKKIRESTRLTGISQTEVPDCNFKAEVSLVPNGRTPIPLKVVIIEKITGELPGFHLNGVRSQPFLKGLPLADPNFDHPGRIDMLLGSDILDEIMLPGRRSSDDRTLHAWETVFGWSIRGKCIPEPPPTQVLPCLHSRAVADSSTDDLLIAFWKSEEAPSDLNRHTDEEQQALDHFHKTHSRNEEGRYIVHLPVRPASLSLGGSRGQACRRFYQNKLSLQRKGKYENYTKALQEYEELGHAEPVPFKDLNKPESSVYYLPSHGVVKLSSTTTKLRIVFDASAKTTSGISLNDILLPGPNLYPLLTDVILAFRTHVIGMSADISKMFREVELHKDDRDLHRFLQPNSLGEGVMDMRMTRVTFGVTSSPFLATQVLRQVAKDHENQFPRASKIISNFYVDDCLTGAATPEEAIVIQEELIALLRCACMLLRKWRSSDARVVENVPSNMREEESQQVIAPPAECHKALGLHWDTKKDTLHVSTPNLSPDDKPTKRKIASDVAKTFDLLGWFAPCTILVKVMLQDLWKLKLAWDDPVPDKIVQLWKNWREELPIITAHPIPRYHLVRGKEVRSLQLHGFSDASDSAYAGVVYLRAVYSDATVSTSLLLAKTKVTPICGSTTPRKELSGAQLLSKILVTASNVLSIPISDVYAWSDSTIVLCWLSTSPAKLKSYVCNRVMDTINRIPSTHWRYVPTDCNPADIASRGASPSHLIAFDLWWKGPSWMLQPPSAWPFRTDWKNQKDVVETKPAILLTAPPLENLTEAFSSYFHLKRIMSWCFRFIYNCRSKLSARIYSTKLSLDELRSTEIRLLKLSQGRSFKSDYDSLLATGTVSQRSSTFHLRPYLDEEGIIRVGGRLENSALGVKQKHPIILHRKDHLSKLICRQLHVNNLHVGPTALLAITSLQYHIIGIKHLIKSVSRACIRCRKVYAKTYKQVTGQLPACRVTPTSPFHHTGADFAGPIMIKRGYTRSRTLVKTYICVFVCMATKAVHLEVVRDLSTEGFLAALRCFVARRGCPETLTTDNGTNFIGAQRELKELYDFLNSSKNQDVLDRYCTSQNIRWSHTPARSPHFGGLWEAAVKSMKILLNKVVGLHNLFMDELYSITVEIEAVLNSRPLTPLDSAPDDGIEVLTPGHFLIGKALKSVPAPDLSKRCINSLSRWNLRQRLIADFWERWSKDYIIHLNNFKKCCQLKSSISVGDIVLIKDSDLYLRSWPLARVIQTHPGDDGLVRVATVQTQKGTYKRAIHKLVPLLDETTLPPGGCSGSSPPQEEHKSST